MANGYAPGRVSGQVAEPPQARPVASLVRPFEFDDGLLAGVDSRLREAARRTIVARELMLPAGSRCGSLLRVDPGTGVLGFLILEGLLLRRVEVRGKRSLELLGSGDLLRPCDVAPELASVPCRVSWRVGATARLAILDGEFERAALHLRGVIAELVGRVVERGDSQAVLRSIARVHKLEEGLLLLLWHLSDRWGVVDPAGVLMPLPLKHWMLADLLGVERPSVTRALHRLVAKGAVEPGPSGGWRLRIERRPELW
jgi:CRP/FNR family cyclic AMP-dependent transcriptional regulator